MKRTKLKDRHLPDYTRGEEIFNMASHAAGGGIGIAILVLCIVYSALNSDAWAVVSSAIYGGTMVLLYTISAVYHGLHPNMGKKVMQVLDHCAIYYLIAGTYTPILFCSIRTVSAVWAWALFGAVWGCACIATVFTAIDLKKYAILSMICYMSMGWCIVFAAKIAFEAIPTGGIVFILVGGIVYTVGAVLYGIGSKVRYIHSVFHLFVVAGSILQFFGIIFYVL